MNKSGLYIEEIWEYYLTLTFALIPSIPPTHFNHYEAYFILKRGL